MKIKLILTGGGVWDIECDDCKVTITDGVIGNIVIEGLKSEGGKPLHLDCSKVAAVVLVER